jgi:hypothetical protein
MAGRGDWPRFYHPGDDYRADPHGRDAHGICALKRELVYNGFAVGIVTSLPFYGTAMKAQVLAWQKQATWIGQALIPDGVIGPRTAGSLWHKRALWLEQRFGIPHNWLAKLKSLESNNDPVAQGFVDPADEGIVQINLHFNPSIAVDQAWDPAWALEFAAGRLKDAIAYCADEEGGVAAWNIGRYTAKQWVAAGKPASGGPLIGGQDGWTRATHYVLAVNGNPF